MSSVRGAVRRRVNQKSPLSIDSELSPYRDSVGIRESTLESIEIRQITEVP